MTRSEALDEDEVPIEIPPLTRGWRMKIAMEFRNKSREYMAMRCGVSASTVSRWLHDGGIRPPRHGDMEIWARECRVPLSWLDADETGPTDPGGSLVTGTYLPLYAVSDCEGEVTERTAGHLRLIS